MGNGLSYTFGKTAKTYDAMGFDTGTLALDFLDKQLEEHGVSVESLLDLACGTGTFALLCASLRKMDCLRARFFHSHAKRGSTESGALKNSRTLC